MYDQNFNGGAEVVNGIGVTVTEASRGVVGVIKDSLQNNLKKGVGKGKNCS